MGTISEEKGNVVEGGRCDKRGEIVGDEYD
jgi:hypothetical protein